MCKALLILLATTSLISCANNPTSSDCSLTETQIEELKPKAYAFMESKGYPTKCEMFTSRISDVPDIGCGIYGNATNGGINPRTGADCPHYLDGGYYVIYDTETLLPKEVVLIAW